MRYLTAILLIFACLSSSAQDSNNCKIVLHYQTILGVNIYAYANPEWKFRDYYRSDDTITFKFHVEDCMGQGHMDTYKDRVLIARQYFINSLGTLKAYTTNINAVTLEEWISVETYFEPLEDGIRSYYDSTGNIIKKQKFKRGIEVQGE